MKKVRVICVVGLLLSMGAATLALIGGTSPATAEAGQAQSAAVQAVQQGPAEALAVQKDRVVQAIGDKDLARADAACNQLLSRFADDEGLPQAAYEIAAAYGEAGQPETARQLYGHVIERWHDSAWAIRSQRDIVHAAIKRKDNQATQAALDTLLTDFAQHADIAGVVYNLAKHYNTQGDGEMARRLHDHNVEHYASDKYGLWSQIENVKARIAAADDGGADAACNKLLTTFPGEQSLPHEIYRFGLAYTKANRPQRAEAFYRYVLDHWPDSPHTAWARLALLDGEGRAESNPDVQAAVAQLIEVLPRQELPGRDIYKAALDLGQNQAKPQRALALHKYNSEHSPKDDQHTVWSLIEVVKAHIRAGDDAAAEEACNTMLTRYADLETLPEVMYFFGDTYTQTGRYDQAEEVFSYIEGRWPQVRDTFWAKTGRARRLIAQRDDEAVELLLHQMMADYGDDGRLAAAVCGMAEAYYEQAFAIERQLRVAAKGQRTPSADMAASPERITQCRQNAIAVFETAIEKWPEDATNAPFAYHFAGECYNRLGDRAKAITYYQKVCDTWPQYR